MKLCNIKNSGVTHLAVVTEGGIKDLTAAGCSYTMDQVIAGADISGLAAMAEKLPALEAVKFANVVDTTGKLVCVGLNYRSHVTGINENIPEVPILFSKFANALVPAGSEVELPAWEKSYDYEAELVIVMGKTAWNVSERDAYEYIFGYTCGNDFSCREPQMRTSQWLIGKTMPGFGPCGPCIVTADEFGSPSGKRIRSYVNSELRQDGNTASMIFDCARIVSYASRFIKLEPGDMIFTGTPSGVQLEKSGDTQRWLVAGDRVDVEIEGIGTLTSYMV